MRFIGIWYNMEGEVKRDFVTAKDPDEASSMLHSMYAGKEEPGPALSVVPASPNSPLNRNTTHQSMGGGFYD